MENNILIPEAQYETDTVQVELPVLSGQPNPINRSFIMANTVEGNLEDIRENHTIPVFTKDNVPLISHGDFISATYDVVNDFYPGDSPLQPAIRLSHEVKGRVPSAKDKPANQLEEWEKTLYYQRMMFCIEIPAVQDTIDGNLLSLTIGGVKSYTLDNLYSKKGSDEHFKLFVGFKNTVCTNLNVWTDGVMSNLKLSTVGQLRACIYSLLKEYNHAQHLYHLKKLAEYSISEQQFALLMGRCRMYQYLPSDVRKDIPPLLYGDTQLSAVVKDYYRDSSFCKGADGNINLWKLYNLFTGANKSSYIDNFLDRSVNAFNFTEQIRWALEGKSENWYLN